MIQLLVFFYLKLNMYECTKCPTHINKTQWDCYISKTLRGHYINIINISEIYTSLHTFITLVLTPLNL